MSIARISMPRCDRCFEIGAAFAEHTIKKARKDAKEYGWIQIGRLDYCPTCAEQAKEQAKKEHHERPTL